MLSAPAPVPVRVLAEGEVVTPFGVGKLTEARPDFFDVVTFPFGVGYLYSTQREEADR